MERFPIPPTVLRFIMVGGLNTLFGLGVYALFALTSLPTWAVLIASNLAGILFNFVTTGGLVFRDLGMRRLPRFLICYGVMFLLYWASIGWLTPLVGGRIVAMAIVVVPLSALTYILQSRFVFKSA